MSDQTDTPKPGISRQERRSHEGLIRLQRQLESGARPSRLVLAQWVKRYGAAAASLIRDHGLRVDDVNKNGP